MPGTNHTRAQTQKWMKPAAACLGILIALGLAAIGYKFRHFSISDAPPSTAAQSQIFPPVKEEELDYYVPHERLGHVHVANVSRVMEWPEHPDGVLTMKVNDLGFREDAETRVEKDARTYRILVTGDSHMDGVVNNSESFANRLESSLNTSFDARNFDVINAGVGYYGPHNYAALIKELAYLKPDMYIVVFYTGNDFSDGILTAQMRGQVVIPPRPQGYYQLLHNVTMTIPGPVGQALNQAYFIRTFPSLEAEAVEIAYRELMDVVKFCDANQIELIVMTLPTKCDFPPQSPDLAWIRSCKLLDLPVEEVVINRRMGESFLARLDESGVRTLDPFPKMLASGEQLYWELDYHVNHTGHNMLAEIFLDQFRAIFQDLTPIQN